MEDMKRMSDSQKSGIDLSGVLDISRVADLREELSASLENGHPLVIEAGDMERVDASILQLLCAFRQAAAVAGTEVSWGRVSEALRQAVEVTGLGGPLGLEVS